MFNRKAVDEKTFSPGGKGESAELKAGTEANQHLVAFTPRDHGSRFGLIYVHTTKDDTI
jgi:hypothetical protein